MKTYETASSDLSIVKTNKRKLQGSGSSTLKKGRLVFDSSSDEELIEPNAKCSSNESDSPASPNVSMFVDFQPTDASITCPTDDLSRTELSTSRVQIPFKYLVCSIRITVILMLINIFLQISKLILLLHFRLQTTGHLLHQKSWNHRKPKFRKKWYCIRYGILFL